MGDSSYMILRPHDPRAPYKLNKIYRSSEQQHYFNCPYQCGPTKDHPYKGVDEVHNIKHNDIVIAATDGIWDNVFDDQIISVIKEEVNNDGNLNDPQKASQKIAKIAFDQSHDKEFESPFQINSIASKSKNYYGGKKDDITVIVSQVKLD
mmetsp:Transcript_23682/g.23570  ORF Transcript_23682/g.23570 Transcript_23682/m.23570 type:complete len:150 (-) Transcript_23682:15-464(-)